MARLLRGVIAMAGLAALPAAPECRTPLGVPCSTIRFQHSQWQFLRDGAPAFSHSTWTSIEAARGDGSSAVITEGGNYRQWFKTETRAAGAASLYLAEEDRVVHVDHAQKTVRRRAPMMWTDRPFRRSTPGDRTCLSAIRHWGAHFFLRGTDSVAGVAVIRWVGANPGGGYTEVYLAPTLDCRALKTRIVYRKLGILPASISTTEAVSVQLGTPKPELFAVPSDYREGKEP